MKLSDFLDGLGSPIAYYAKLSKALGGVSSNVFLSQLCYWQGKQKDSRGWIYKTQAEIQEETGLTRSEQETARKNLKSRGLIEERFTGIPRRLEFLINVPRLKEWWETFVSGVKTAIAEVPQKWNRTEKEVHPTVTPELEEEVSEQKPSSSLTDEQTELTKPTEPTSSQTNQPVFENKNNTSVKKTKQSNKQTPEVDKFFGNSRYHSWAERQHPALVYDALETPWLEEPGKVQYLRFVQDFLILGGEEFSHIRGIGAADKDKGQAIALIEKFLKDAFPGIQYEVIGTAKNLSGAKDLANRDKYHFQWWACDLVKAQPYQGKKKGADSGIDGEIYFTDIEDNKPTFKKIIVSVKGGENVGAAMVRDLNGTIQREKAVIGLFVTLTPPTKPMEKEAAMAGLYKAGNGREYPRVQILTIEDLLSGRKRPEYCQSTGI